ncbi:Adenylate kinase isoenzyme 6 [Glugoides intestinalis]
MKVLVTGTPGVGKSTLSKQIADENGIEIIEITSFVKENKLYEQYDAKLDTLVFDEETVIENLKKHLEGKDSFIIDTHSPVVVEGMNFDFIFHILCDTTEIARRLEDRGYTAYKIEKNVENEIFNAIGEDLAELFGEENTYKVNGSSIPHQEAEYTFEEVKQLLK